MNLEADPPAPGKTLNGSSLADIIFFSFFFSSFLFFSFFFLREGGGEGQRQRERENLKQPLNVDPDEGLHLATLRL